MRNLKKKEHKDKDNIQIYVFHFNQRYDLFKLPLTGPVSFGHLLPSRPKRKYPVF